MNQILIVICFILLISGLISVSLLLIRREFGQSLKGQDHINSSIFSFFATLYAFFIGFAIVTLWSTFLTTKANVNREADAIMITYRTSRTLPNSETFRQVLKNYVKTVLDDEWPQMEQNSMSEATSKGFDEIWAKFYELPGDPNKLDQIYNSLMEAGRQRLSRSTSLEGNLYPLVWIILIFGLGSVIFGLYLLNRQQSMLSYIFEFMVIFLILTCLYLIYDIDTPFSGIIMVKPDAFWTVYNKMLSLP